MHRKQLAQQLSIIVAGMLFSYIASTGPVVVTVARHSKSMSEAEAKIDLIYAPLVSLSNCVPAVSTFFGWYIDLWIRILHAESSFPAP